MPKAPFFSRLGLFVVERFFTPEYCAALRAELQSSAGVRCTIERDGAYLVDDTIRRTSARFVSDVTRADVSARLGALRPELERHFKTTLVRHEPPFFAEYVTGDYFRAHADRGTSDEAPQEIRDRRVALVVFLNDEADEPTPGAYCGGELTFYGLFQDPQWKPMGLPVRGETGLLIGFSADLVHEVRPITYGERYTVVTRFS